ncbi:DUF6247 family protein [Actinomycetospora soli]|uniref:DUF6247 family protein n=1 Tax=Actinomycetospora soli TaxID=2893887 RepID=UPI001E4033D3|nr:DUF6247 family protein [Actinomycetospora soli]MCD2186630.1 YqzG/YhdC family protein [Actinomycetospora soli]
MTTSTSPRPERRGSLARGASPASIRAALLPEDKTVFDAAYEDALERARRDYDLAALHDTLENWRRQAIAQSDPEAFRLMVRRAAAFFSGEPVPSDEPFAVTRAKAGM